jgi:hypothetical protein
MKSGQLKLTLTGGRMVLRGVVLYINFPLEYDAELGEHLKENNPFRDVSTRELNRYSYQGDGEEL